MHTFDLLGWLSLGNIHLCTDCLVLFNRLCVVSRGRNVSSPARPVDVNVLALRVFFAGVLRLDPEGVCTKVVTLSLEEVGGQVLGAVSVVEAKSSAESGRGNTPQSSLGDDTNLRVRFKYFQPNGGCLLSPAGLSLLDGLVEEIVEQQVFKIGVCAVSTHMSGYTNQIRAWPLTPW